MLILYETQGKAFYNNSIPTREIKNIQKQEQKCINIYIAVDSGPKD